MMGRDMLLMHLELFLFLFIFKVLSMSGGLIRWSRFSQLIVKGLQSGRWRLIMMGLVLLLDVKMEA